MLSISNKRIIDFYERNTHLDFEVCNLIFIDLFEKLFDSTSNIQNDTIQTELMREMSNLTNKVDNLEHNILHIKNELSSQLQTNILTFKREIHNEIEPFLSSSFSNQDTNIQNIIKQHIDTLNTNINSSVQKLLLTTHESQHNTLLDNIKNLEKNINDITTQFLSSTLKNKDNLYNFIQQLERKYTETISPIVNIIQNSENRLQTTLTSIKNSTNINTYDSVFTDLSSFLNKYRNSTYKGQLGENKLEGVLNTLYPTGEIMNTTGIAKSCDFHLTRENKPKILIETKEYNRNVNHTEVDKFIRDIKVQKNHALFLSQHSGIASKQNFHIDIIDIKERNEEHIYCIAVYIHNVDYNQHLIKIGVDIIDSLDDKINTYYSKTSKDNQNSETISITNEQITEINKQYKSFLERKITIVNMINSFHTNMLSEMNKLELPEVSIMLNNHSFNDEKIDSNVKSLANINNQTNSNNTNIVCDICNVFKPKNTRSLAAHKVKCSKKHNPDTQSTITQYTNIKVAIPTET